MKKSCSVLAVTPDEKPKDTLDPSWCSRSYTSSNMLGADLRRGRRRLSSSLQVPPWKSIDRARSPEPDNVQRPTTLPLRIPPRISITHADPDRIVRIWKEAVELHISPHQVASSQQYKEQN